MAGDKSSSTTDDAFSNQQVGQGSKVNRAGQNTRIDSQGRTVNFNTGPAPIAQKTAPDRVLPGGIIVEDYSRPFQGQINLSGQAMPAPEPEARSYLMSDYLATKPIKQDPLSYERFLEDARNIGNTLLDTPLDASPAQTITNAQEAFNQAKQIQQASPEMQALSKGYNLLANQRLSAPFGSGTLTFTGGQTPGLSYSQDIGPGFGKGNPLAEGIMSLMNVGKRRF
jgi:hypothetical protein